MKKGGNKLTFIDLFAGCGGLSEGFLQSDKFEALAHIEWEMPMITTLRNRLVEKWNHTEEDALKRVIHFDIQKIEAQNKDYRLKLCDKIRIVREKRGRSQVQLGEKMAINRSTISKIENGKFGITVDYLVRFSIFLDYEFKLIER